jgi:selenide,water dikinase
MLLASENVSARLHARPVPLLEGALECVRAGYIPGGLNANRDFAECVVEYRDGIPEEIKTLLFDPQTAGGLLISVTEDRADELVTVFNSAGIPVAEIGKILSGTKPLIQILG